MEGEARAKASILGLVLFALAYDDCYHELLSGWGCVVCGRAAFLHMPVFFAYLLLVCTRARNAVKRSEYDFPV